MKLKLKVFRAMCQQLLEIGCTSQLIKISMLCSQLVSSTSQNNIWVISVSDFSFAHPLPPICSASLSHSPTKVNLKILCACSTPISINLSYFLVSCLATEHLFTPQIHHLCLHTSSITSASLPPTHQITMFYHSLNSSRHARNLLAPETHKGLMPSNMESVCIPQQKSWPAGIRMMSSWL